MASLRRGCASVIASSQARVEGGPSFCVARDLVHQLWPVSLHDEAATSQKSWRGRLGKVQRCCWGKHGQTQSSSTAMCDYVCHTCSLVEQCGQVFGHASPFFLFPSRKAPGDRDVCDQCATDRPEAQQFASKRHGQPSKFRAPRNLEAGSTSRPSMSQKLVECGWIACIPLNSPPQSCCERQPWVQYPARMHQVQYLLVDATGLLFSLKATNGRLGCIPGQMQQQPKEMRG